METFSRRVLILLFTPAVAPFVFSVIVPDRLQAGETDPFLLAAASPADPLNSSAIWVDDIARSVTTYFAKKYPAYDFAPYAQELNRIRGAIILGDHLGAKREMGVFLKMLASRAYGLGDDAAEEMALLSQQMMPEEEFGIVYPGSAIAP